MEAKLSLLDSGVNCTREKLTGGLRPNCGDTGLVPWALFVGARGTSPAVCPSLWPAQPCSGLQRGLLILSWKGRCSHTGSRLFGQKSFFRTMRVPGTLPCLFPGVYVLGRCERASAELWQAGLWQAGSLVTWPVSQSLSWQLFVWQKPLHSQGGGAWLGGS